MGTRIVSRSIKERTRIMQGKRIVRWRRGAVALMTLVALALGAMAQTAPQAASAQAKAVGEIKSIGGGTLVLSTDDGKSLSVSLPDGVRVVRIAPGATDLKGATPIMPQSLLNTGPDYLAWRSEALRRGEVASAQLS